MIQTLCCPIPGPIRQLLHQSDSTDTHAHSIFRRGRAHGIRGVDAGIVPAHNRRSTFADSSCDSWYNLIRWQPAIRTCVRYGRVTKHATPLHKLSNAVTIVLNLSCSCLQCQPLSACCMHIEQHVSTSSCYIQLIGALCAMMGLHLHPASLCKHVMHALSTAKLACQSICCRSQCPGVQAEQQMPDATGPCLILPCSSAG